MFGLLQICFSCYCYQYYLLFEEEMETTKYLTYERDNNNNHLNLKTDQFKGEKYVYHMLNILQLVKKQYCNYKRILLNDKHLLKTIVAKKF